MIQGIKAVFLDAGETLLFADPPVERVYGEAFLAHGLAAGPGEIRGALHATWREVDRRREAGEERWGGAGGEAGFWSRFVGSVYARLGGGELPDALLSRLVAHFGEDRYWRVYPEVPDVLCELRARGLRLVVVSNWDSTLPSLLSRLGLLPHFDAVVVSALAGVSKPSRGIFEEALRLAGAGAAEALHVGDSLSEDYEGARAAGLRALLLDRRGRAAAGVDRIGTLADLLPRLDLPGEAPR